MEYDIDRLILCLFGILTVNLIFGYNSHGDMIYHFQTVMHSPK